MTPLEPSVSSSQPHGDDTPDLAHSFCVGRFLEERPQGYCFDLEAGGLAYVLAEEFAHVPLPEAGQGGGAAGGGAPG